LQRATTLGHRLRENTEAGRTEASTDRRQLLNELSDISEAMETKLTDRSVWQSEEAQQPRAAVGRIGQSVYYPPRLDNLSYAERQQRIKDIQAQIRTNDDRVYDEGLTDQDREGIRQASHALTNPPYSLRRSLQPNDRQGLQPDYHGPPRQPDNDIGDTGT